MFTFSSRFLLMTSISTQKYIKGITAGTSQLPLLSQIMFVKKNIENNHHLCNHLDNFFCLKKKKYYFCKGVSIVYKHRYDARRHVNVFFHLFM